MINSNELAKEQLNIDETGVLNCESIHIAFITDENYSMPTTIAITSLRLNRNKSKKFYIHIVANNITEYSKNKFLECGEDDFIIDIIDTELDDIFLDIFKQDQDLHVSPSAILKMHLPTILSSIDKVLYIDGDVLIQKDLIDLYNTDISGKYAAVVKDIISERNPNHMRKMSIQNRFYFNSGMMLLNLAKLREDNLESKLIDYRLHKKNHFIDQDAFNAVFNENVVYVSWKYNYLNKFHDWWDNERLSLFYEQYVPKNKKTAYNQAVIIHFGSQEKPWLYKMGYLSSLYMKYYKKSPYKNNQLRLEKFVDPVLYLESIIKISKDETLTLEDIIEKLYWNRRRCQRLQDNVDTLMGKIDSKSTSFFDEYVESENKIDELFNQLEEANRKYKKLKNSKSFKIGQAITWLPRKTRYCITDFIKKGK